MFKFPIVSILTADWYVLPLLTYKKSQINWVENLLLRHFGDTLIQLLKKPGRLSYWVPPDLDFVDGDFMLPRNVFAWLLCFL